jgi:ligand-binding sensor domain-containing protein
MEYKCNYLFQNRFSIILFLTFFANTFYFSASSQTFSTKTFTTDNGLSHNFVQHITQDTTGFIWIATWDGINRYDGYEFKGYYHNPNDSATFPFFIVDKLIVDKTNRLWILCDSRPVVIFNRARENFEFLEINGKNDIPMYDMFTENHNIWLINLNLIYQYNDSLKLLRTIKMVNENNEELKMTFPPQLVIDNQGTLWIFVPHFSEYFVFKGAWINDSTVQMHNMKSILLSEYAIPELKSDNGNFDVHISEKGRTWMFSRYGMYLLDSVENKFVKYNSSVDAKEFASKKFFLWGDFKTGLNGIDTKLKEHLVIQMNPGNSTEAFYADRAGNIWAGNISETREDSKLMKYSRLPVYFSQYLTERNNQLEGNQIFPIIKDRYGNIWAGSRTSKSLFRIKPDGTTENMPYWENFNDFNRPIPRSMAEDSAGIWIGCTNDYLIRYSFSNNKFTTIIAGSPDINIKIIPLGFHNIIDDGRYLLVNGNEGIYRFDKKTYKFNLVYKLPASGIAQSFISEKENDYWIGVWGNLVIHLNKNFEEIQTFKLGTGENLAEHICIGDSSDIWVALMGGGLGHLYPKSGRSEIFTIAEGLTNNTCYSILKDKSGNLWISTNQGISMFNPKTRKFRKFGKTEGLKIEEFNSDSWFQAADGEMFFGGVGGLVSFYPDRILGNNKTDENSPLVITNFKISGRERLFNKAIYDLDCVTLEKGENNFQLTFACLDFQNGEKINYRYRLKEEDNNWVETSNRERNVNYSNLLPGTYHFEIQCTNKNGEWSSSKKLTIQIPAFYYQTLWFRLIIIFFILILMTFIAGLIIRQIKLQSKQKQNELKLESLRSQMNPHFVFNALNSVNYFISNNDKVSANSYIADFSRLIRATLNNLSHDFIPLGQEIESIRDYLRLEHLRFSDKFNYELKIELSNINLIAVFPGLVQPFVENAVWHGVRGLEDRKGFVRISFKLSNINLMQCVVEDDGIGRRQAEIYKNAILGKKSRGIGIVTERLKIISEIRNIQYQIKIEDLNPEKKETGTRVIIEIPIETDGQS